METITPHAVLLASPGMGHLIPILELGKRLIAHHHFQVTVFVVATDDTSDKQTQLLKHESKQDNINLVIIPSPDISNMVNPAASLLATLAVTMRESIPAVRLLISNMIVRPTVFMVDMFGTETLVVAREFKMSRYVYFTSTAWFLALTLYAPILEKEIGKHQTDLPDPIRIPGCKPVQIEDALNALQNRNSKQYVEFVRMGHEMSTVDGILVNTWDNLEPTTLQALREDKLFGRVVDKVPVYPIGPLVKPVAPSGLSSNVSDWLDKQPTESVMYVSFGSGGTLTAQQTTELAWGLKLSQQRFLWVLREPTDSVASGTYFSLRNGRDGPLYCLPDGFLTLTQSVGLVVPMWAPQAEIMSHKSIGGFLSHCGWNSTLEGITNGVPMIAWPLYAEQRMNAAMLTEELGLAVRPATSPLTGLVMREEIAKMVRMIMIEKEGMTIRDRLKELKCSAEKALKQGGSSYNAFSKMVEKCNMNLQSDLFEGSEF